VLAHRATPYLKQTTPTSCGYYNFLMLLPALYSSAALRPHVPNPPAVSILDVQKLLRRSWEAGSDPVGARHYAGCNGIEGSTALTGAADFCCLLRHHRVRCDILSFARASALLDYCRDYFYFDLMPTDRLTQTELPPLFLQREGHSLLVVGVVYDPDDDKCNLLIFDPEHRSQLVVKGEDELEAAVKTKKKKTYQVIRVDASCLGAEEAKKASRDLRFKVCHRI
jgi:hypothetical protein